MKVTEMMVAQRVERIVKTLSEIVHSDLVAEYRIGITATPDQRRSMYARALDLKYGSFAILETGLLDTDAKSIEKLLQAAAKGSVGPLADKYDPSAPAQYHPSIGGSAKYRGLPAYSVYVAWRSEPRKLGEQRRGGRQQ
jgi:hypothetical protein